MNQLTIGAIISTGFHRGADYFLPVLLNFMLWALTLWIPYINAGATIGLWIGMTARMSRNEPVRTVIIFDTVYRRDMGQFFLLISLMLGGIYLGLLFLLIPGIIAAISWILAPLLVIDRGMGPMAALKKSGECTHGKKWVIFGGLLFLQIACGLVVGGGIYIAWRVLGHLGGMGHLLTALSAIAGISFSTGIQMGACSYIYAALVE